MKLGLAIVFLFALVSCGDQDQSGNEAGQTAASGFEIDTVLLGHQVHVSMNRTGLLPAQLNELRILVDNATKGDWGVFTSTRQATIRMDTIAGTVFLTPTDSAESVIVRFRLPEYEEYGPGNPFILIPVDQ